MVINPIVGVYIPINYKDSLLKVGGLPSPIQRLLTMAHIPFISRIDFVEDPEVFPSSKTRSTCGRCVILRLRFIMSQQGGDVVDCHGGSAVEVMKGK